MFVFIKLLALHSTSVSVDYNPIPTALYPFGTLFVELCYFGVKLLCITIIKLLDPYQTSAVSCMINQQQIIAKSKSHHRLIKFLTHTLGKSAKLYMKTFFGKSHITWKTFGGHVV